MIHLRRDLMNMYIRSKKSTHFYTVQDINLYVSAIS